MEFFWVHLWSNNGDSNGTRAGDSVRAAPGLVPYVSLNESTNDIFANDKLGEFILEGISGVLERSFATGLQFIGNWGREITGVPSCVELYGFPITVCVTSPLTFISSYRESSLT